MRAGPLSKDAVIDTLNHYFVSVYTSQEDYESAGRRPRDEIDAYNLIYHTALDEKRSCGSVSTYITAPNGKLLDSAVVSKAIEKDTLLNMLNATVEKLGTKPGDPVVKPHPQSAPPEAPEGALVLYLVARAAGTGPTTGGSWHEFPSENWIVLNKDRWTKLLPNAKISVGDTWPMDKESAAIFLFYFYPQTEDTKDIPKNRIDEQSLKATVVSIDGATVHARLEGAMKMKHNFYPGREDNNFVEASLIGYIEFNTVASKIISLKLVTEKATYAKTIFDVAVTSTP